MALTTFHGVGESSMTVQLGRLGELLHTEPWGGTGRILVVEDDRASREVLAEILTLEGCEVRTAADGAEALAIVQEWPPSLILLDLRMPEMDGYAFARRYRELPGRQAPIVLLSASWESAEAVEAIGAVESVDKPFKIDDLLEVVERYSPCSD
jgi:CheY-like chemotaxis protein